MSSIKDLKVNIIGSNGKSKAWLSYDNRQPSLRLDSSKVSQIDPSAREIEIRTSILLNHAGFREVVDLEKPVRIHLSPHIVVEREYVLEGSRPEPLYPPSSNGWFSRIVARGSPCIIFLHDITNDDRKWLSIVDANSHQIFEAHPVSQYEAGVLELTDEAIENVRTIAAIFKPYLEQAHQIISDTLDRPPPSWSELSSIAKDVYIPGLHIGETMRSTMEQLVPNQMTRNTREQVMAFLSMIIRNQIPDEDPVDYFFKISPKLILASLLHRHLQSILRKTDVPSYVRIFQESAARRLPGTSKTVSRAFEDDVWQDASYKISDSIHFHWDTSLRYAAELNKSGRIITQLPVTRKAALSSKRRWTERFELMLQSFQIRTDVRPLSIGLNRLVYIGSAHQWPHKHLKWSTRLGGKGPHQPHVHVMEMPPKSTTQVIRSRPNLMNIEWSTMVFNDHLFNNQSNEWKTPTKRLLNSVAGSRTVRRLGNEFGKWKSGKTHTLTPSEARILDMTANNCELSLLEQKVFLDYWHVTQPDMQKTLENLKANGVIAAFYRPNLWNLTTIVVLAQGDSDNVCALARGILKHTPVATPMIGKGGDWLLALTRMPPATAHEVVAALPEKAADHGVTVRCDRASSFRSYVQDFYSRILLEDGTWDDDVSAMLSQIRVPYRDSTLEEN